MKFICIKSYPLWNEGQTTDEVKGGWTIKLNEYPEYWKCIGEEI